MKSNKAFLFSDLHASKRALDSMYELIIREDCSLILFAGDIVNQGEPISFAEDFLKMIEKIGLPFLWIPGNNDFGRSYDLVSAKYPTLEGRVVEMLGRKFTGVGGSPESWAGHYAGKSPVDSKSVADSIFITHAPPPVSINLMKFDRKSQISNLKSQNDIVNCKPVRPIGGLKIENSSGKRFSDAPLVHICGHVHDRWGVGYLRDTKIVKLAPFFFGHYAIMDLETLYVEFGKANARPLIG